MTITKSGALASFYTVNKAPIKHLRVYFSPKQAGSGTASPENVRAIEGRSNLYTDYTGQNLLPSGTFNVTRKGIDYQYSTDGSIHIQGYDASYTFLNLPSDYQFYIPAGTYTLSCNTSSGITVYMLLDGNDIEFKIGNGKTSVTKTIPSGIAKLQVAAYTTVDTTIYPQLEVGSTASSFKKPMIHRPQTIDWSNDIGTIYGGYIDLITGELVQTYITSQLTLANIYSSNDQYFWYTTTGEQQIPSIANENAGLIADRLQVVPGLGMANPENQITFYTNGIIRWKENGTMTLADYRTYLSNNPITICYQLANPITHQLSPQSLSTFLGRNNIWSNADRVEVEYDLAESNDELYRRRNILLQGAPHIESVTGAIANFSTDIVAPLKECKVHFEPIQAGTGDPSPSNVREITGWNGVTIKQNGGNLIDPTIAGSTQGQTVQTNVTPNADGTVTIAGRDGTGWVNRAKIDLPVGTYRLYSNFGSGYFSRYEINDIAEEINWQGYRTLTLDEPSYLRFKPAMGTDYPVTGWLQLLYGNNDYDPRPYIEEKINVTFPTVGKNLLDPNCDMLKASAYTVSGDIITQTGSDGRGWTNNQITPIHLDAGTYALSCSAGQTLNVANSLDSYETVTRLANGGGTITLNQACYVKIKHTSSTYPTSFTLQVERGSSITAYEPYTTTIYGGYIDLISGEIIQTHFLFQRRVGDMDNNESYPGWKNCSDFKAIANYINNTDNGYGYNLMCNVGDRIWYNSKNVNPTVFIYLDMKNNMTQTEWKTNYPDLVMKWVLPLAVPIHYPLTPQTLKTLKGTNNIWSSANGPVSIKYWTH